MSSMRREVEVILRTLEKDYGCTVTRSANNHWRVCREGFKAVTVSNRSGDTRVMRNIRADIKRNLGISI